MAIFVIVSALALCSVVWDNTEEIRNKARLNHRESDLG